MKSLRRFVLVAAVALVASLFGTAKSDAGMIYSFTRITNNAANNVASQLQLEVSDIGGGQVNFTIRNLGPTASSIAQIYFDDGTLLGIASIINGSGTDFSQGANPSDLPGGNTLSPPFVATQTFNTSADNPAPAKGINPGENVQIIFNLQPGTTFADTIAALNRGDDGIAGTHDLRVGLHVISIGTQSDSFVTGSGNPVPAPPSVLMLGMGALCLGFGQIRSRLRSRAQAA